MEKTSQAGTTPSRRAHRLVDQLIGRLASKTRYWWLLLVAGLAWSVIAFLILRFTYDTVVATSVLFGALCLLAAADEVIAGAAASRGWRIARWLLAALFVVAGVVALVAVKAMIVGLAAVMSFLFICRGALAVGAATAARKEHGWWVLLTAGLAELAIGLLLASLNVSLMALVRWVAVGTLVHGIGQIASAFLVRNFGRHVAPRPT